MNRKEKLSKEDKVVKDDEAYFRVWLGPYISYSNKSRHLKSCEYFIQFMQCVSEIYLKAAKRGIRYIKFIIKLDIKFKKKYNSNCLGSLTVYVNDPLRIWRTEIKFKTLKNSIMIYLKRRIFKRNILSNKIFSFHNDTSTTKSSIPYHLRTLQEKYLTNHHNIVNHKKRTKSLNFDTIPLHKPTWWWSILLAVLFHVRTVSPGNKPTKVMKFLVFGTYSGCR